MSDNRAYVKLRQSLPDDWARLSRQVVGRPPVDPQDLWLLGCSLHLLAKVTNELYRRIQSIAHALAPERRS
jgi:hypothetical protein